MVMEYGRVREDRIMVKTDWIWELSSYLQFLYVFFANSAIYSIYLFINLHLLLANKL